MSKKTFRNSKQDEQAPETRKKRNISLVIGIVVVLVIVAVAYFLWPKPAAMGALKIEDIVVGDGREAKVGDTLTVEYTGWLESKYDTQPFDSPKYHDTPFQFVLGNGEVVEGWDKGLIGMKVGGKRKLTVPAEMAYGAEGAGNGRIPPNSPLIFEVSLLNVLGPVAATLPATSIKELKIEDLVVGSGAEAQVGKTVKVHYTGWLENGTKFDSSLDSGGPIEFVLGTGRVIDGWEKGLVGMKVGGKRKLSIPPDMGYGDSGSGEFIPPGAALIFEVELLEVK